MAQHNRSSRKGQNICRIQYNKNSPILIYYNISKLSINYSDIIPKSFPHDSNTIATIFSTYPHYRNNIHAFFKKHATLFTKYSSLFQYGSQIIPHIAANILTHIFLLYSYIAPTLSSHHSHSIPTLTQNTATLFEDYSHIVPRLLNIISNILQQHYSHIIPT